MRKHAYNRHYGKLIDKFKDKKLLKVGRAYTSKNDVIKRIYYHDRFFKRASNRKIRYASEIPTGKRGCYKLYDYWWKVF